MAPIRQRSIINKTDSNHLNAIKALRKSNTKDARNKTKQNKNPVSASKANTVVPGADTAFKAFLSARFCAAIWSHISDCDETFNYWEPLHYLVYGQGLQTWEYSPKFALRSYTYLLVHGVPAWIYTGIFNPNPMLVFYFVRCMLGLVCAIVEVYFYKAICREFGIQIGRVWLICQLFSPGMFIASTALLPSTFSMYFGTAALAAWWNQKYRLAVFFVAISSLLGWPFGVLIGVPICFDMIVRQKLYRTFAIWAVISAATILIPMLSIDSSYFGRMAIAPLNIILYNVFTSHGPDLYGIEPLSYYFLNGFLNFNVLWLLALIAPVMLVASYYLVPAKSKSTLYLPHYISLAPFYLWILIFMLQPHKEERFLFPIYPLITLCGAVSIDVLQKLFFRAKSWCCRLTSGSHYLDHATWISVIIALISAILGILRILSLYRNYHAPLDLMMELSSFHNEESIHNDWMYNVCLGKDWYRFPNSFFLPSKHYRVRFLQSEFKGMLPAYFTETENGTTIVHDYFNDMNRGNPAMHFNQSSCHFLLDLDLNKYTRLEPNYANQSDWIIRKSLPFLNAEKSHSLFRSFFIPFLNDNYVQYSYFHLLQRKKLKTKDNNI